LSMTACVSSKKYKAATASALAAKNAGDSLMKKGNDLQTQLDNAISSNKMLTEERDRYQKETDSASGKLKTLQSAVDDYTGSVDQLQKKTADRMADYAERGVEVTNKDGMVHVTMQDKLLYKKGSNKVAKDGETALGTLASVLNENPNLKVLVVGHTDDRAGKGGDNWTVSTERANNIVRMLKTMKIDPSRLTSAGQGQYNAAGDNSTAEGRAQNRRTEIILSPESFKLLNKE
ncbi:MAG: OmpA family protein, partial [Chitinophagaceae bacterium]|nr:OmpA family protein [Chitinophagaceae bacterium]